MAASTSAQARLESELAFSNGELVTARAAAARQQAQHAQQAPDLGQHDRLQPQRDAELRAEAQAQHARLKSELASSQMASLQEIADAAERERQQQQATWQADMTEAQARGASEKDALQRR